MNHEEFRARFIEVEITGSDPNYDAAVQSTARHLSRPQKRGLLAVAGVDLPPLAGRPKWIKEQTYRSLHMQGLLAWSQHSERWLLTDLGRSVVGVLYVTNPTIRRLIIEALKNEEPDMSQRKELPDGRIMSPDHGELKPGDEVGYSLHIAGIGWTGEHRGVVQQVLPEKGRFGRPVVIVAGIRNDAVSLSRRGSEESYVTMGQPILSIGTKYPSRTAEAKPTSTTG